MFDELSLNQYLKAAYPTAIFLLTVLALCSLGEPNSAGFQGFPNIPFYSWPTSDSKKTSCKVDRVALHAGGMCRIDLERPKVGDKIDLHEGQKQLEANRSLTTHHYQ